MSSSFTPTGPNAFAHSAATPRRRILVTGAAGKIGSHFAEQAFEKYELRLMVHDVEKGAALGRFGEVVAGDLLDLEEMKKLCDGVDTVLHLAARASPESTWSQLLDANIIGAYHTFVAAKAAGCRRVVFASSIHAVSGYPADVQVKTSEPVNPGDLYGVSKCFGEALGRYMAEKEGLSVIALRIGAYQSQSAARKSGLWMLDAFVSHRDLQQLIERCIEAEDLQFAIFHGLSNNRFKRLDISDARELVGYQPQDDVTEIQSELAALHLADKVRAHNYNDPDQKSGIREELKS